MAVSLLWFSTLRSQPYCYDYIRLLFDRCQSNTCFACFVMLHAQRLSSGVQVLAAQHKHVSSPAQRSIHSLRSLLLVAKLAWLVFLGGAPGVKECSLLRLFWFLLYPEQEQGCEAGEASSKEEETEIAFLEFMKVHMLLPLVRHGMKGLEKALLVGSIPSIHINRTAAVLSIRHWIKAFDNEQMLAKAPIAQELYRAGRPLSQIMYVLLPQCG